MSGFAPGDVVVCVDANSPPRHLQWDWTPSEMARCASFLVGGRTYRVAAIVGADMIRLDGDPWPARISGGFFSHRFRKIDPATESFTAEMRACRPIKHREPA